MPSEAGMLPEAYWSGLEWVRFLLNGSRECRRVYRNREWLWQPASCRLKISAMSAPSTTWYKAVLKIQAG